MSIEYTLNKPNKIKLYLKSEYIYRSKDFDIKQWINADKKMINPIQKHIKKANDILIKIVEEEKSRMLESGLEILLIWQYI